MTNSNKFTPEELNIIEVVIQNPFSTYVKLSEITGLHRTKISSILNRPHVEEELKSYTLRNIDRFNEIQQEALEVYSELLKSDKDSVRLNAGKPFIEALKTTKVDLSGSVSMNPEESVGKIIDEIRERTSNCSDTDTKGAPE